MRCMPFLGPFDEGVNRIDMSFHPLCVIRRRCTGRCPRTLVVGLPGTSHEFVGESLFGGQFVVERGLIEIEIVAQSDDGNSATRSEEAEEEKCDRTPACKDHWHLVPERPPRASLWMSANASCPSA